MQTFKVGQCDVHDFSAPEEEGFDFDCVSTSTRPNVKICIFNDDEDIYVSKRLRSWGAWERHLTTAISQLMGFYSDPTFVDIGANLGIHSLVVAKLGFRVIAVEPQHECIRRLVRSVKLNGMQEDIVLVKNVVFNARQKLNLNLADDNKGAASVHFSFDDTQSTNSIILDDLLDVILPEDGPQLSNDVILKLDIQASEYKALMNSTQFFRRLNVRAIIMEWEEMRRLLRDPTFKDKDLIMRMVANLRRMGYVAYSMETYLKKSNDGAELSDADLLSPLINIAWVKDDVFISVDSKANVVIDKIVLEV